MFGFSIEMFGFCTETFDFVLKMLDFAGRQHAAVLRARGFAAEDGRLEVKGWSTTSKLPTAPRDMV